MDEKVSPGFRRCRMGEYLSAIASILGDLSVREIGCIRTFSSK